jgi:PDZ domain-containing protein
MTRQTASSLLACAMLAVLFTAAALMPVPYVAMSPGYTLDVLAAEKGEPILDVEGQRTYPTEGTIELTTIWVTQPDRRMSLGQALSSWFDRTEAVYPRDVVYPPDESVEDSRTEGAVQMVSSQDSAVAAALKEIGYAVKRATEVAVVTEGAPAEGKLRSGDQIVSVDGSAIRGTRAVVEAVQRVEVGQQVRFVIRRDDRERTVQVTTRASEDDPNRAVVGVVVAPGYDFPFRVSVNVSERIGGPSAGLTFALGVYDKLTRGALAGGRRVAGTGTITPDGKVGPIGGIQQKVVTAADAGADVFLVPPDNCAGALDAPVGEDEITLVRADSLHSVVTALDSLAQDQDADLPSCQAAGE